MCVVWNLRKRYMKALGVGAEMPERNEPPLEEVVACNGLVVGTTCLRAQEIGVDILRQGGSAMDAALATAMAQITLNAGATVSFAGSMDLLYFEAATGKVHNLNAGYNTARAEDYKGVPRLKLLSSLSELSGENLTPKEGHYNGRTVPVPGFMRGVDEAHQRFGRLSRADVFAPAIQLAEEGFDVTENLGYWLKFREKVLSHDPQTRAQFITADDNGGSRFYQQGDTFRQPALAETLRQVMSHGADYMYEGPWAKKFVEKVQGIGGRITMADMKSYQASWAEPVRGSFGNYDLYACGLPNYGGTNFIEAMHLLEAANVASMGPYTESPEAFYWLSHITRNGCSRTFLEGKRHDVEAYMAQRQSKQHAQQLWEKIEKDQGWWKSVENYVPRHSDAVVAVDSEGNVASLTHTINAVVYGETGLVIDGVSVPDSLLFQWDLARITEPGERLPSEASPVIVMKDDRAVGAFAGINMGLHEQTVNVVFNTLARDIHPQAALNQPAFGMHIVLPTVKVRPFKWRCGVLPVPSVQQMGSGGLDHDLISKLAKMGLKVGYNPRFGGGDVVGLTIDPETDIIYGGACDKYDGRAVGY